MIRFGFRRLVGLLLLLTFTTAHAAIAEDSSLSFFDHYSAPEGLPDELTNSQTTPSDTQNTSAHSMRSVPAENASPVPVAGSNTPSVRQSPQEKLKAIKEFQIELAESAYQNDPTSHNRDALILTYEQLMGPICMPHFFRDLKFEPGLTNEECRTLIEKVRALDRVNPFVTCVEKGIDSAECRTTYMRQTLGIIENESQIPRDSLNAKLNEASTATRVNAFREQLRLVMNKEANQPSDEVTREKWSIMKNIIEQNCKVVVLLLTQTDQKKIETGSGSSAGKEDPLKALVDTIGNETPLPGKAAPTVNPRLDFDIYSKPGDKGTSADQDTKTPGSSESPYLSRKRLISRSCSSDIGSALEIFPDFPAAICYRDGLYTPACIESLRKARAENQAKTPAAAVPKVRGKQPNDGLRSF